MKHFFIVACLFVATSLSAQTTTTNQFFLNFLIPSAEYEFAVSENSTVDALAGVGFGYRDSDFHGSEFGFFPQVMAQYRHYYNFKKRNTKGKKTSENSGNYIAAVGVFSGGDPIFGDLELNNDYNAFIGPAWGLQRVYGGNFKLNLNLGLGLGFNDSENSYLSPLVGLQLGWKLGK